mmetsp:Transcript_126353/g.282338  ORF Transcript_126353/g.282338 Transcript_126353/m.282338 type:complete len:89 (-) Transcript_126353:46-312(-)
MLVQPVFDSPGGIIFDLRNGFGSDQISPPKLTEGGFWHHGYVMAAFQVSGLLCIAFASIWSAGIFKTFDHGVLQDNRATNYGSHDTRT